MLDVLIDTSILRHNPQRKSAAFQALSRVGNAGGVTTHVPSVVRREFLGFREEEHLKPLQDIKGNIEKLLRRALPTELKETLTRQLSETEAAIVNLPSWVESEFDLWCGRIGAQVHAVRDHHGEAVLDAYFRGRPPFREKKSRADFPDGFIIEAIKDVVAHVNSLHVVTADKGLRDAASQITGVLVYESLDGFILSEECQAVQKDAAAAENFEAIIEKLKSEEERIGSWATGKLFDELVGYRFADESIPDDNHEATVEMLDVPNNVGIVWDEAEYYGDGIISLPFSFDTWVLAGYYIFKADYHALDEGRQNEIGISEYDNRHYYEAQEEFLANIRGKLALSLDLSAIKHEAFEIENLDDVLAQVKVEASEIEEVLLVENGESKYDRS